jgi:hypothetical protein
LSGNRHCQTVLALRGTKIDLRDATVTIQLLISSYNAPLVLEKMALVPPQSGFLRRRTIAWAISSAPATHNWLAAGESTEQERSTGFLDEPNLSYKDVAFLGQTLMFQRATKETIAPTGTSPIKARGERERRRLRDEKPA